MFETLKSLINRRSLLVLAALAFIFYAGVATFNVISRNFQLQQEVDQLAAEVEVLELRNQELEYEIAYYRTDAFVDKEARDKLGLKMPGENVVIISNRVPPASRNITTEEPPEPETFAERSLDNLEQWMYFLFRIEPGQL